MSQSRSQYCFYNFLYIVRKTVITVLITFSIILITFSIVLKTFSVFLISSQ